MNRIVFVVYGLVVGTLSLLPGTGVGGDYLDKLQHLLAYYVFAVLAYRATRTGRTYGFVCLGIIAYGCLLEVAQSFTPDRFMSVYDMLANTLGVLLGTAVVTRKRRSGAA